LGVQFEVHFALLVSPGVSGNSNMTDCASMMSTDDKAPPTGTLDFPFRVSPLSPRKICILEYPDEALCCLPQVVGLCDGIPTMHSARSAARPMFRAPLFFVVFRPFRGQYAFGGVCDGAAIRRGKLPRARGQPVYQECLAIEFELSGIPFRSKAELKLEYKGRSLKQTYQPDFIVFDKIILELKALSELHRRHRAQVHNYLKATGLRLGLLVNFGAYPQLERHRIIR
jgi:GxxExxY protein